MITGARPKTWAMGMPEFLITDLGQSLAFRTGVLGFRIACSRPEQSFVCLEHPDGAQRMMYPRDGAWEVGAMERPFGRGVVFQVYVRDVDAMARAVIATGLPFCVQPRAR
jgi:catechol 2,3-dioxygenase-like lactoylglutathione lyase family enzyme